MSSQQRQDASGITLSHLVATVVTFRRLVVVWGIAPLIVAAAPLAAGLFLAVINFLSSGYGFMTTLGTASITFVARRMIQEYAPSPKQADAALKDTRFFIPLASFFLSRTFILFILAPIATRLGFEGILLFSPGLPYLSALRVAACMMLLGAAVLVRYFSLHNLLASDTPGHLIARPSLPAWKETGIRYDSPSIRASVGQLFVSTIIGYVLACAVPLDLHSDQLSQMVLIATCTLTVLSNLVFTALDGRSHEIDIRHYQSTKPQHIMSFRSSSSLFSTFGSAAILVPAVAVGLVSQTKVVAFNSSMEMGALFLLAFFLASVMAVYLILIDETSKYFLCIPGMSLEKLVEEELPDDTPRETTLHIMLESILQGNGNLVRAVLAPTQKNGVLYAEDAETRRGDDTMHRMAQVLLGVERRPDSSEACLEHDILRASILESLGGQCSGTTTNLELLKASPRHVDVIKRWAHPQNALWLGATRREPDVVPLVRALCAYASGLGEALFICRLPPNHLLAVKDTRPHATWSIPPGARSCSEWAIRAAARLIVYSCTSSKGLATDWRSSTLSVLIPVMLHAAFHLRKAVLSFTSMTNTSVANKAKNIAWIAGDKKLLRPVIQACEESAIAVVQALQSEGGVKLNIQLNQECHAWIHELTAGMAK